MATLPSRGDILPHGTRRQAGGNGRNWAFSPNKDGLHFWEIFPNNSRGLVQAHLQTAGEPPMRISEDRYDRDRQRLELALRFLTHEARTQTIRVWTGLSDDRIRKLYRSYLGRAACYVPRHRGQSPHQSAYFIRSLRIQQETSVLASFFALAGLVPAEPSAAAGAALPDLSRGNALCNAFETYAIMIPTASISFEYAVFLAECLARGDQLRLGRCCDCGGIIVVERFPIREKRCQHCVAAQRDRS
jgi:hypothetical protein